jgi:hypothetical protein
MSLGPKRSKRPGARALELVHGSTDSLILRELQRGARNLDELTLALPAISREVLSEHLSRLTREGWINDDGEAGQASAAHAAHRETMPQLPAGAGARAFGMLAGDQAPASALDRPATRSREQPQALRPVRAGALRSRAGRDRPHARPRRVGCRGSRLSAARAHLNRVPAAAGARGGSTPRSQRPMQARRALSHRTIANGLTASRTRDDDRPSRRRHSPAGYSSKRPRARLGRGADARQRRRSAHQRRRRPVSRRAAGPPRRHQRSSSPDTAIGHQIVTSYYGRGLKPCAPTRCRSRSAVSPCSGMHPQITTSRRAVSTSRPDSRAILQSDAARRLAGTSSPACPSAIHSGSPCQIESTPANTAAGSDHRRIFLRSGPGPRRSCSSAPPQPCRTAI